MLELNQINNHFLICNKLDIKPITLIKALQTLHSKGLLENDKLTTAGKRVINYLNFRNNTISSFLEKSSLKLTKESLNKLYELDFQVILSFKNLLDN